MIKWGKHARRNVRKCDRKSNRRPVFIYLCIVFVFQRSSTLMQQKLYAVRKLIMCVTEVSDLVKQKKTIQWEFIFKLHHCFENNLSFSSYLTSSFITFCHKIARPPDECYIAIATVLCHKHPIEILHFHKLSKQMKIKCCHQITATFQKLLCTKKNGQAIRHLLFKINVITL